MEDAESPHPSLRQPLHEEVDVPTCTSVQSAASPPPATQRYATVGVQAHPDYSAHEVNTDKSPLKSTGMNHSEGCWPAEVDPSDGEQVARWRKKIERDESYIRTILRLGPIVENLVKQNNAMDIYTDYFADVASPSLEPPILSTLTEFLAPGKVQCINWCNEPNSGKIAVAYTSSNAGEGCIFDVSSATSPLTTLSCTHPIFCLAHNLREHAVVGAGLQNGQFALFDSRQDGHQPSALTDSQCSHTDCITSLAWTQSKTGTEFLTASLDGEAAWWDSRRLSERIETVVLKQPSSQTNDALTSQVSLAANCIEYSVSAGPAKFMIGTTSGIILSGNRRASSPTDKISASFSGHLGSVSSLSRHPFLPKYFLSIGDWTARVWADDVKSHLIATPFQEQYLSGGLWSETRPAVFYAITRGETLAAWDLLHSHAAPALSINISDSPLTCIDASNTSNGAGLLAVGCTNGATLVVKPGGSLCQSPSTEREDFASMMGRESGREKSLEKASKEAKAKAKREAAKVAEPITRVTAAELQQLEADLMAKLSGSTGREVQQA